MCGRFTLTVSSEILLSLYEKNQISFDLKWGLIPSWAKDEKIAFKTINAKAETLLEKPAFKVPFMRKRCIIPTDEFQTSLWLKSMIVCQLS